MASKSKHAINKVDFLSMLYNKYNTRTPEHSAQDASYYQRSLFSIPVSTLIFPLEEVWFEPFWNPDWSTHFVSTAVLYIVPCWYYSRLIFSKPVFWKAVYTTEKFGCGLVKKISLKPIIFVEKQSNVREAIGACGPANTWLFLYKNDWVRTNFLMGPYPIFSMV